MLLLWSGGAPTPRAAAPAATARALPAEKRHRTFTRNGSDLATTLTIPLETALAGGTAQVRWRSSQDTP